MIVPNLASRPFLNTRPVWLVTVVAGALTLLLLVANVYFFVSSRGSMAEQIALRDRLEAERRVLESEVRGHVQQLEKVPWQSLESRVTAANVILREHSFSWLRLLDDLARVMPYDVRMVQVSPSVGPGGVTLQLKMVARTRDSMLDFLENLIADPSFTDPKPLQEITNEGGKVVGWQLVLSVDYDPPERDA